MRPPDLVPPAVRRQWRAERQAVQEAARRRDRLERMSPRERQLAAIAESRGLADVATERAAVATDPIKKAELETLAADLRRQANRQERDMPAVDTTTPGKIRAAFTDHAAAIRSELDGLAADDGREATWKNRRRSELVDALDVARQTADRELLAWATKAATEAGKHLAKDSRTAEQVAKDTGTEMKATRLAKTVEGTAQARNILYSQAERLAAAGDEMGARAYAMAAQIHNVPEASKLLNRLEADYRATWEGHAEAAELAQTAEKEVAAWRIEAAAITAQTHRSAIQVAKLTGDLAAASHLGDKAMHASIASKTAAYAIAQRDGLPYVDPVGPDTTPTREPSTQIRSDPSTADL